MNKPFKVVAGLATAAVLALSSGAAYAVGASQANTTASTTTEPPAYGACVSTKTGALRVLEKGNLAKSRDGACKQDGSEKFMLLSSGVTAMTKMPAQLAFTAGGKNYVCSEATVVKLREKLRNGRYGKVVSPARYSCGEAVRLRDVPRRTVTPTPSTSVITPP